MTQKPPHLTLIGVTDRSVGTLKLTFDYKHLPDETHEELDGLAPAELEATVQQLKRDGWLIESQCANPSGSLFTEIYTFTRPN